MMIADFCLAKVRNQRCPTDIDNMKLTLVLLLLAPALPPVFAGPLYSPDWGFSLDLPEGYELAGGDGRERFSFAGPGGAVFDLRIYSGAYKTMREMADDIGSRLQNRGEVVFFEYHDKFAAIMELRFGQTAGWGFCVELAAAPGGGSPPMLLALSYGPAGKQDLQPLYKSALDSIIPSDAERHYPGPITEFGFPRGERKRTALALPGITAMIHENDAEAAQALVDREFALLSNYRFLENWREAWIRFYRVIYRDSWDRVADAVFQLERRWNIDAGAGADNSRSGRALAEKALAWVQTFKYERDLMGSDFVNLVSAVTEGRGDCDSRAMLWAMILAQADIPAGIMVSREHNHAMGMADIAGAGARFEAGGINWLVAETTAPVGIGLIGKDVSGRESWLGVVFEQPAVSPTGKQFLQN
jgi:hypothetical protein